MLCFSWLQQTHGEPKCLVFKPREATSKKNIILNCHLASQPQAMYTILLILIFQWRCIYIYHICNIYIYSAKMQSESNTGQTCLWKDCVNRLTCSGLLASCWNVRMDSTSHRPSSTGNYASGLSWGWMTWVWLAACQTVPGPPHSAAHCHHPKQSYACTPGRLKNSGSPTEGKTQGHYSSPRRRPRCQKA